MEQNVQVITKRMWHVIRVAFFMLRKNLCKKKLLLDLKYFTMKHPKLAGKSLARKLTHRHPSGGAYEFSCSNDFPFKKAHRRGHVSKSHAPIHEVEGESEMQVVERVLESMMVGGPNDDVEGSPFPYFYSPVLPGLGFGQSPVVRVTDSPYPMLNDDEERETGRVDEAAEEFIQRFYAQLRHQRIRDA